MKMNLLLVLGIFIWTLTGISFADERSQVHPVTTRSSIALENLDQQIAQSSQEQSVVELLLLRSRLLDDYDALDRATEIAEGNASNSIGLLHRARARSAVHRFADALADLDAAERAGADSESVGSLRASILVAVGKAEAALPYLKNEAARHPGYGSRSTLAVAYAALGRLDDADRLYVAALADLDTTLPFPYAWIWYARGMMWAEQAGNRARAERMYREALSYVPEFAAANINLAELEIYRGDCEAAMERLQRVVAMSDEPEALGLLGQLHLRRGNTERGRGEISRAREHFEALLRRHPLAFADHGAEFYLGAGADPERAWELAQQNLANRETGRAFSLAIKAAEATGHPRDACALEMKARELPGVMITAKCSERFPSVLADRR